MLLSSKEPFSFALIGRFAGRRPSIEWMEDKAKLWSLSRPYVVSLTNKGYFISRFNSLEDKVSILSLSPLSIDKKKVVFLPWSPGQDEAAWPSIAPVWIRLTGLPYHCWSQNIIFSIANSIGHPIKLDNITMAQKILTFSRVLVNIDLSKPKPPSILVNLQVEGELEISVEYEHCPCSLCLSLGHSQLTCPLSSKPPVSKP
eukprot:TRINITY_DN103089_c0_g1_i1.p1 TRINITY_DN103089_c0_g1~~TRINITY_DN103089_c0_g1_i1.p1  ORF type:complete len:201 (+),score=19.25 TRINITY_DN103089_c0_g1_i1:51-653(+)